MTCQQLADEEDAFGNGERLCDPIDVNAPPTVRTDAYWHCVAFCGGCSDCPAPNGDSVRVIWVCDPGIETGGRNVMLEG